MRWERWWWFGDQPRCRPTVWLLLLLERIVLALSVSGKGCSAVHTLNQVRMLRFDPKPCARGIGVGVRGGTPRHWRKTRRGRRSRTHCQVDVFKLSFYCCFLIFDPIRLTFLLVVCEIHSLDSRRPYPFTLLIQGWSLLRVGLVSQKLCALCLSQRKLRLASLHRSGRVGKEEVFGEDQSVSERIEW